MKKKVNKAKSSQFPNNYRFITDPLRRGFSEAIRLEKLKKKHIKVLKKVKFEGIIILYTITIFTVLFFTFDIFGNLQKQREINFQKAKIESEIKLWENITDRFKGYKEAYYQLAILEYQLNNIEKAKMYINKSLYLDPNFEKAKELKKILFSY